MQLSAAQPRDKALCQFPRGTSRGSLAPGQILEEPTEYGLPKILSSTLSWHKSIKDQGLLGEMDRSGPSAASSGRPAGLGQRGSPGPGLPPADGQQRLSFEKRAFKRSARGRNESSNSIQRPFTRPPRQHFPRLGRGLPGPTGHGGCSAHPPPARREGRKSASAAREKGGGRLLQPSPAGRAGPRPLPLSPGA